MEHDWEKNKKLAKFFKATKNPSKRLKCLVEFIEKTADSDLRSLYHAHYSTIYSVFLDALQLMELNASSNKGKSEKNNDVIALFDTFSRLLRYEKELIGTRWQSKSIANVIVRMLHPANKHYVRLMGITNTFYFVDALGHPPQAQEHLDLVSFFVILSGFYEGAPTTTRVPDAPPYSFTKQIGAPSQDEGVECLERAFTLASSTGATFDHWFQYIRQRILHQVYVLPTKAGSPPCPVAIQCSTIKHFRAWARDPKLLPSLGSDEERMSLTMEVFRQGCELPLLALDSIESTIKMFYAWVRGFDRPPVMAQNWPRYEKEIVLALSGLFTARGREHVDRHVSICQAGLGVLRLISQQTESPDTWVTLLKTLMNLTNNMVVNYGTSGGPGNVTVGRDSAPHLVHLLFNIWVRVPAVEGIEDLWKTMNKRLPNWLHCPDTMVGWRRAVVMLTKALLASVYGGALAPSTHLNRTPASSHGGVPMSPGGSDSSVGLGGQDSSGGAGDGARGSTATSTKPERMTTSESTEKKGKRQGSLWSGKDDKLGTALFTPEVSSQAESNDLATLSQLGTGLTTEYDPISGFTTEQLFNQWEHLLVVIGNPNELTDASTHSIAFGCLGDLVNLFFNSDNLRPQSNTGTSSTSGAKGKKGADAATLQPQIPLKRRRSPSTSVPRAAMMAAGPPPSLKCSNTLLSVFGPWLFEACTSANPRLSEGTALAFSALCRLTCRVSDDDISTGRLAAFFRIVHEGLAKGGIITRAILLHSDGIFSLNLPGATLLIPSYLKAIRSAISGKENPSPDLQDACVRLTMSMLFTPTHYGALNVPDLDDIVTWRRAGISGELDQDAGRSISFDEVSDDISQLIPVLPEFAHADSTKEMCLWGLAVLLFHTKTAKTLTQAIKVIRQHIFVNSVEVSCCALSVLVTLAQEYEKIALTDTAAPSLIITGLCQNIMLRLEQGAKECSTVIGSSLEALQVWILAADSRLLADNTIAEKVFDAVQSCYLCSHPPLHMMAHETLLQLLAFQSTFPVSSGDTLSLYNDQIPKGIDSGWCDQAGRIFILDSRIIISVKETRRPDDKPGRTTVHLLLRSAASQFMWRQVLDLNDNLAEIVPPEPVNTFSTPSPVPSVPADSTPDASPASEGEGGAEGDNPQDEKEGQAETDGDTTAEVAETPGSAGATGNADDKKAEDETITSDGKDTAAVDDNPDPASSDLPQTGDADRRGAVVASRQPEECFFSEDRMGFEVDMLGDYVSYLQDVYPELPEDADDAALEADVGSTVKLEEYEKVEALLKEQAQAETEFIESQAEEATSKSYHVTPPSITTPPEHPTFTGARVLLSHLGLLTPMMCRLVHPLEPSEDLHKALLSLDSLPPRPQYTASVVYAKDGQMLAADILGNDGVGSAQYENFLQGLGWRVDLDTHRGFHGKLTPGTDGTEAVYFADQRYELMYHTLTLIPSNSRDNSSQSHKRVFLLNDRIHIVFSEYNKREFWPGALKAPTALVFIVVSPLPSRLFHVRVLSEVDAVLGPLIDGMVVPAHMLAPLVRMTVVSAHRALDQRDGAQIPSVARANTIKTIDDKYGVKLSPSLFVTSLLNDDGSVAVQA